MPKSPVVALEVRYRPVDIGFGSPAWQVKRFPPTADTAEIEDLVRGGEYEVEARNVGHGDLASAWVPATVTIADEGRIPFNEQVQELNIDSGVVHVDTDFTHFRLTLNANVTSVVIDTPPEAATLIFEIEQWGAGSHTINWPANVVPVSGEPHVMTATPGAVDIVTLQTTNGGGTWYMTVFAAGVAFAGTISPSPATGSVVASGSPVAPDVTVAMTTANGTDPVTHSWTRNAGSGADFLIDDDTIASPTFTIPAGTTAFNATQSWRDTCTDATGKVCQATVNITLARTVSGGGTVDLPPTASDFAVYPAYPSAYVAATVSGSGPWVWSRIDTNGGTNFSGASTGPTANFTGTGPSAFDRTQTWRLTDTSSGAFDDIEVHLTREI